MLVCAARCHYPAGRLLVPRLPPLFQLAAPRGAATRRWRRGRASKQRACTSSCQTGPSSRPSSGWARIASTEIRRVLSKVRFVGPFVACCLFVFGTNITERMFASCVSRFQVSRPGSNFFVMSTKILMFLLEYTKMCSGLAFTDKTIRKRVCHLFKPYNLEGGCYSSRLGYVIMHRSMRKHVAMRVIKTWCSSWATSWQRPLEWTKMCSCLAFTDRTIRKRICNLFKPFNLEGGCY